MEVVDELVRRGALVGLPGARYCSESCVRDVIACFPASQDVYVRRNSDTLSSGTKRNGEHLRRCSLEPCRQREMKDRFSLSFDLVEAVQQNLIVSSFANCGVETQIGSQAGVRVRQRAAPIFDRSRDLFSLAGSCTRRPDSRCPARSASVCFDDIPRFVQICPGDGEKRTGKQLAPRTDERSVSARFRAHRSVPGTLSASRSDARRVAGTSPARAEWACSFGPFH